MDECIEWQGSRDKDGYGKYRTAKRRDHRAHRVAWEEAFGPIPPGMLVLHRCDNPPCVKPAHLFLGTPADNMRDKMAKGRHRSGRRPGRVWCKLEDEQATEMIDRYREGGISQAKLAAEYGVSQQLVSRLINEGRPTW